MYEKIIFAMIFFPDKQEETSLDLLISLLGHRAAQSRAIAQKLVHRKRKKKET